MKRIIGFGAVIALVVAVVFFVWTELNKHSAVQPIVRFGVVMTKPDDIAVAQAATAVYFVNQPTASNSKAYYYCGKTWTPSCWGEIVYGPKPFKAICIKKDSPTSALFECD